MRYGALLIVGVLLAGATASPAEEAQSQAAGSGIQVKVFNIRNGDATSRAEMLRLVLGQGSSGIQPLRITAELRTNSILAVGAAGDLEVIRALLARLDDPSSYRLQLIPQASPTIHAAQPPQPVAKATVLQALTRRTDTPPPTANDTEVRWKSAKVELERQESLRTQRSTEFSSREMARARLAVGTAQAELEQLAKPVNPFHRMELEP
jgi:hypothetical protein